MGTVIGAFVGGLLAIGAAVLIYQRMSGRKDAETPAETSGQAPPDPAPDTAGPDQGPALLMTALVNLNIRLRTSYGLPRGRYRTGRKCHRSAQGHGAPG